MLPRLTTVVNIRRTTAYDVYIGRPSKWGNPYRIGRDPAGGTWSRGDVIRLHRQWVFMRTDLLVAIPTLVGQRLGCYCTPLSCHGDLYACLANALPDPPPVGDALVAFLQRVPC